MFQVDGDCFQGRVTSARELASSISLDFFLQILLLELHNPAKLLQLRFWLHELQQARHKNVSIIYSEISPSQITGFRRLDFILATERRGLPKFTACFDVQQQIRGTLSGSLHR